MTQLDLLELLEKQSLDNLASADDLYKSNDVSLLLRQTESNCFDRKSARIQPDQLAICLSAFGNGPSVHGGVILIGVENDGRVTGCLSQSTDKIQQLEFMGRDSCPSGRFQTKRLGVQNFRGEDDFIIVAKVDYVEERLVALTNGEAYCRESDKSRKLTVNEKDEIRIDKGERSFELEPCQLDYPDDFRTKLIAQFAGRIRSNRESSTEISDEEILESMRLGRIRQNTFHPNNVCALMFAKDPQRLFPGSYIRLLQYEGNDEKSGRDYNVIKDRMIEGTILDIIKQAATTIDASLRDFTEFKAGKFTTVPEYPRDAWYELLVNACVHRSYHARTQPIFIKIFDDHLIIENPGSFMPSVTPDHFFHKPRNRFLMFALREFGEVKCISEGTRRIKKELHDARLPPIEYTEKSYGVIATIRNDIANRTNSLDSEAYQILGDAISFSLSGDERRIVNYVVENKRINVSDALRILTTTNWHTAKNKLKNLTDRGILEFLTSKDRDPNAHYVLKKK
ncbi:ATP-binding protein [Aureimonas sp. AU40]|uniref:ATP-binding protein n=1 Tax=Aureimonas sp. AU40 TaxID=1637747 RepID=UPI0009E83B63|nr:ATP-binding protein [Aureimonas sp. AU40]